MKRAVLIFLVIIFAISTSAGWFLFSRYVRPYHYQLLRPYTISSGASLVTTEYRLGENGSLQILIPEGDAKIGKKIIKWQILIISIPG
ncbi:MAG: hypothetical protein AB9907_08570 [Flexilinea sp.]